MRVLLWITVLAASVTAMAQVTPTRGEMLRMMTTVGEVVSDVQILTALNSTDNQKCSSVGAKLTIIQNRQNDATQSLIVYNRTKPDNSDLAKNMVAASIQFSEGLYMAKRALGILCDKSAGQYSSEFAFLYAELASTKVKTGALLLGSPPPY